MPVLTIAEKKKLVKALPHHLKHKAVMKAKAKHQSGHGLKEIFKTVSDVVGHPATQLLGKVLLDEVIKPALKGSGHHRHHKHGSGLRVSGHR